MQNVIRTIFLGKSDAAVHSDFLKFSRGVFENRYLLEAKKQKAGWAIKTSAEFANFLVRHCLSEINGSIQVSGIIVSTSDIMTGSGIQVSGTKKYQGITQFITNSAVSPSEIIALMDKYPRAFYALSFSTPTCELKIKAKPPKNGKPGNKTKEGGGPKANFCSLKTSDFEIVKDLFFDKPEFQQIKIKHTLEIKEVEVPSGISNPVEMREKSVRRGAIKRKIIADGQEFFEEKDFVA